MSALPDIFDDEGNPPKGLSRGCSASSPPEDATVADIEMGSPLAVKKTPRAALSRCEWGKDDYSLKVENLPKAPPPKRQMDLLSAGSD